MMDDNQDIGASGRATHEQSQQAVSAVPVGIPDAVGLRFCRDCKHLEGALLGGSFLGGLRCLHPASYGGGNFDLVSGQDGRRFKSASEMRLDLAGRCGRNAALFESAYPRFRSAAQAIEAAAAGETRSGSTEGESAVRQDAPNDPRKETSNGR